MEILRIARQNESLTRNFSPPQCGQAFLPVHLASNTGGTWLTTFSIAKSRKPINNLSTGPSLLFFGRKIKAALVGIPALLGMPIFLSRRYAPVFEVEPLKPGIQAQRLRHGYGFFAAVRNKPLFHFSACTKKNFHQLAELCPICSAGYGRNPPAQTKVRHKKTRPAGHAVPIGSRTPSGPLQPENAAKRYLLMLGGRCLLCFFSL